MKIISVSHSGNCGDIIYSLPSLISLIDNQRCDKIDFYVRLNMPMGYSGEHPLGNVLMNEDFYNKLKPLLESQTYINKVEIYSNQRIDLDLDTFRRIPINYLGYSIPRWYFLFVIGAKYDTSKSWLEVEEDKTFKDYYLVSRNNRTRSQFIKYDVLNEYASKLIFVGVEKEFKDFKQECPNAKEFYCADNFLNLAKRIKGSKGLIGCQGFPFTLAEALKIKRLLETNTICPNNIPEGGINYEALFQQGFNHWVKKLFEEN